MVGASGREFLGKLSRDYAVALVARILEENFSPSSGDEADSIPGISDWQAKNAAREIVDALLSAQHEEG